jgi:hypothetical protein
MRSSRSLKRNWIVGAVVASGLVALLGLTVFVRLSPSGVDVAGVQVGGSCGLSQPAFCDTFDQPAGTGNRSGQLNGVVWGVSHATGQTGIGGNSFNSWTPADLTTCSGTVNAPPANDIVICNGQLREATNDGTNVTTLSMYVKQPFDFAGRTGIASFDVSNDTQGSHAAWPEFWITDQPGPAPFTHEATWVAVPRNGFGIRFAGYVDGHGAGAPCPEGSPAYVGVDSAITVSNYAANDSFNGGNIALQGLDCVKASTGPGQLNHYEIHVSQGQIDIFGTDAGTVSPLKHLAHIGNTNLTFSRGVIWIEDVHYNGNKFNTQRNHTFSWDNVGFDGPALNRDLTFDVLDGSTPGATGTLNLGWFEAANAPQPKTVTGVTNISQATAALLTFNFFTNTSPTMFTYGVNGHSHTAPWPYPGGLGNSWRTLALPVPLADVVSGSNTVSIASDQGMVIANIDLVLAGAGGGGGSSPPPPTATPAPVSTAIPTNTAVAGVPTNTVVPTNTAVAATTCKVQGKLNGVDTSFTRPAAFCTNQ